MTGRPTGARALRLAVGAPDLLPRDRETPGQGGHLPAPGDTTSPGSGLGMGHWQPASPECPRAGSASREGTMLEHSTGREPPACPGKERAGTWGAGMVPVPGSRTQPAWLGVRSPGQGRAGWPGWQPLACPVVPAHSPAGSGWTSHTLSGCGPELGAAVAPACSSQAHLGWLRGSPCHPTGKGEGKG